MKKLILIIFSSLTFITANAQKQISIDSAAKYIGQTVAVCDSVYGVKGLPHLTFVNIGSNYPNQKLTLVFYKKDLQLLNIDPVKIYQGKRVCVSGKIILYEQKPQIVIKFLRQIVVKSRN